MNEITLKTLLIDKTQKEVAEIMGITQGAVWQMLKNSRDIRFRVDESGTVVDYFEIKKPKSKAVA